MRLIAMKPLRASGLSGARRRGWRAAGLVVAVLAGGSLTLGVAILWAAMFASLRRVDRMESVRADISPEIAPASPRDRLTEQA